MTLLWIICFVLCANVNTKNKRNGFRLIKPQSLYMVLYTSTCMEIGSVDCITVTGHISTTLRFGKTTCISCPTAEFFLHINGGAPLTGTSWTGWLSTGSNGWTSTPNYAGFSILKKHVWALFCPKIPRELSRNNVLCVSHNIYSSIS